MLSWFQSHMLPCAYKAIFGIDCPVCGFQRSLLLLLKGDFKSSFLMYPPLLPFLALIILLGARFLRPTVVAKKHIYRYSTFLLSVVAVNYAVKLAVLYV